MKDIKKSRLSFTKKEVKAFDKKYLSKSKNFLLKNDKWKLIGDTYYQIPPKLFSPRWFRNLSRASQVITCVLLGGTVSAAVVAPTVITIELSKNRRTCKEVELISFSTAPKKVKASFFSKNPNVVYVPVFEYNNYVDDSTMRVIEKSDDMVDLKNLSSYYPDKKAHLNLKTGELTYDSYSMFSCHSKYPHEEIAFSGYSERAEDKTKYTVGEQYTINLKDYNLQPIKDNDIYYLPLEVLIKIDPTIVPCLAYYNPEEEQICFYNYKISPSIETTPIYPSSFYKYCYDLFTFDIDLNYGLNGYRRYYRSNDTYFTFNKDGARKTFDKYQNDLINSKTLEEFDSKFSRMFYSELDDGGHSAVYYASFGSDYSKLDKDFGRGKEHSITGNRLSAEQAARKKKIESGEDPEFGKSVATYDTDSDGKADIGYLYFTGFDNDGFKALLNANVAFNKNITSTSNIKDVVIDIAYNGGGSTALEGMMLSWICGGEATQVLKDARDNSVTKSVYKYNLYNTESNNITYGGPEDYLPDDVNIYILTDATFSAACALTFDAYMYTKYSEEYKNSKKNIKFIGKPNLGGACSVTNQILLPTGLEYRLSSTAVGVNWNDYSKTCDELMPMDWELSVDQIMDRVGTINPQIVKWREK